MCRTACLFTAMVVLFLSGTLLAPPSACGQSPVIIKRPRGAGGQRMDSGAQAESTSPAKTGNAIQFKNLAGGDHGR